MLKKTAILVKWATPYLKIAKLNNFWAGIFINSLNNINEVSKASATDSVSQWQGQAKNGSSPKQIWRWWYWQQRASSGETLINSVSGGRELHKFIPGPPDCQKSRIRICWFYKLYFAYLYLNTNICICLFGLDWLDLPDERYPFSKILCSISWIHKEDETALFRKEWNLNYVDNISLYHFLINVGRRKLCRHSSNVVNLQDPSTSEAVSGIGFQQFAARQPGSRSRMLNLLSPGTCWRMLNLLNLEAAEGC